MVRGRNGVKKTKKFNINMKYKIYKKTKSAMQSGNKNSLKWSLEPLYISEKKLSSTFCWNSVEGTTEQIKVDFNTLDEAIFFAKTNSLDYKVIKPNQRKLIVKSYAENFKPKRN